MKDNEWVRLLAYILGIVNQRLFLQWCEIPPRRAKPTAQQSWAKISPGRGLATASTTPVATDLQPKLPLAFGTGALTAITVSCMDQQAVIAGLRLPVR